MRKVNFFIDYSAWKCERPHKPLMLKMALQIVK